MEKEDMIRDFTEEEITESYKKSTYKNHISVYKQ